jgi:hypothetical protein
MIPFIYAAEEKCFGTVPAVMVNGGVLFTIVGGPIAITALQSVCVTANDGTASTLQYSHDPTDGAATTISAASASLASAAAGATVTLQGTALSTAPTLAANGAVLGQTREIILQPGTITSVVGVGSTTGTWKHNIRYRPLNPDAQIAGT